MYFGWQASESAYVFGVGVGSDHGTPSSRKAIEWDGTDLDVYGSIVATENVIANNIVQIASRVEGSSQLLDHTTNYEVYNTTAIGVSVPTGSSSHVHILLTVYAESASSSNDAHIEGEVRRGASFAAGTKVGRIFVQRLHEDAYPSSSAGQLPFTIEIIDTSPTAGAINYYWWGMRKWQYSSSNIDMIQIGYTLSFRNLLD
jgi:hypothetical protein